MIIMIVKSESGLIWESTNLEFNMSLSFLKYIQVLILL
jgi:hypothetical protein